MRVSNSKCQINGTVNSEIPGLLIKVPHDGVELHSAVDFFIRTLPMMELNYIIALLISSLEPYLCSERY